MPGIAGAATITVSGSAELGSGTFSDTAMLGDSVILGIIPENQWTSNGVKVNSAVIDTQDKDHDLRLISNGAGGALLTWTDYRTDNSGDVYAAAVDSNGTATEIIVASGASAQDQQEICQSINSSTVTGAYIIWRDDNDHNIYAKKYSSGGSWIRSYKVCTEAAQAQLEPDLVSDQEDGFVAVWRDYRDGNAGAIYGVRLDSSGSLPGATQWVINGNRICSNETVLGVTTEARTPYIVAMTWEGESQPTYMVAWKDSREGNDNFYCTKLNQDGNVALDQFELNGIAVVDRTSDKDNLRMKAMRTYNGASMIWREGPGGARDIYCQIIGAGADRWLGDSGYSLAVSSDDESVPRLAALSNYYSAYSWVRYSGSSYSSYIQRLTSYGTPEWGSPGKLLSQLPIDMCNDGSDGLYQATILIDGADFYGYIQRIDTEGRELWGSAARPTTHALDFNQMEGVHLVNSDNNGVIICWIESDVGGNKDIYVQKFVQKYQASGSYTSAKIENPDPSFEAWTSLSWSDASLTGEVRTAASSSGLDSATWETLSASGASVASNGKWLQARFSFAAGSGRTSTPQLSSFTLAYASAGDTTSPEVVSVKVDGVELVSGDPVAASPTIDFIVSDDRQLASLGISIDDNPESYTLVSTSETSWEARSLPAVASGSHTFKVSGTDTAGNTGSRTYTIERSSSSGVKGGSVAAMASGSSVIISYVLENQARLSIDIRDITGRRVRHILIDAGSVGAVTGYNEVSIDASDLAAGPYIISVTPVNSPPAVGRLVISE
ncbi:MAG: hypothetical protein JW782_01610 [Candidatus Saganbacteria bacterium]|nr:hypothetical protein [Candidatus Saganbacteria bacterium]